MTRPCFLVIDREYSGSISTRKLVIETAKFNVLTAYSAAEAIETIKRFPTVDGAVMDAALADMRCDDLVRELKEIVPGLVVISVRSPMSDDCDGADYQLESFDPKRLLALLTKLRPEAAGMVERHDEELQEKERQSGKNR
jgi:DNA-binding response OmpR family regulator